MNIAQKIWDTPPFARGVIGALVFAGVFLISRSGYLQPLELWSYDGWLRLRPALSLSSAQTRIALITISEEDIQELGQWPISDAILAAALRRIEEHQPRAIGIDIYRDVPVPPGHEELETIFSHHSNIVATMKFGGGSKGGVAAPPVLKDTEQVGFNDVVVDPGGTVHRGLLFLDDGDSVAYSFALRLALQYLEKEGILPQPDTANPEHLRLGQTTLRPFEANDGGYVDADAKGYQFVLDFREKPSSFSRYPMTRLLAGEIDAAALKDKIVLLGVTAQSVKDLFYTPLGGSGEMQETYGIELHALVTSQLLRSALEGDRPIATVSDGLEALWILLWSILGAVLGQYRRSSIRYVLVLMGGLLLLGSVVYSMFLGGWWIPLAGPSLAWVLSSSIVISYLLRQESQQRALLMNLFARHLSPEIAEEIWEHRDEFLEDNRPRPRKMVATVMFTDVYQFTALSEKLEPQVLIGWLNEYLESITPLITAHRGVVIRFIGDAIMAAFGVPLARTAETEIREDAIQAVECALAMERKIIDLNIRWNARKLPTVGMRVGIYTGPLVVGSIGNSQRLEYSIHGDTVNTASRLESFDKDNFMPDYFHQPTRILIGDATLGYVNQRFKVQRYGEFQLRGKEQKDLIYRVLGKSKVQVS